MNDTNKTIGSLVLGRQTYHVDSGLSVREASRYMTDRRIGAVAVLQGSRLTGIVSERDIMGRVVAAGRDLDRTKVSDVMSRDLVVAHIDDSHEEGLRKMKQAGCRHLPVVEGERLVGMVSQRDLLQIDLSEKDEEIRWLNAYIHFIPPAREGTS
jgi:CBS domain-containing protein